MREIMTVQEFIDKLQKALKDKLDYKIGHIDINGYYKLEIMINDDEKYVSIE